MQQLALRCSLLSASLILGCTPQPGERQPPPLPEGAELLMEVDGLSIYNVEPGEICEGDLSRIVEQWHHLIDYLEVEDAEARLVLFDFQMQNDALQAACSTPNDVGGCAPWWGANSTPKAAPHELAHVLVFRATNNARPNPFLEEGLAEVLEAQSSLLRSDSFEVSISERLLDTDSLKRIYRRDALHFTAWALDRYGIDELLRIYEELGPVPDSDLDGFAQGFGFETIDALQEEFESTAALEYPPPWRLEHAPSSAEWSQGIDMTPGCEQVHTHRIGNTEWVKVLFEAPEPGRYRMVREGIDIFDLAAELQFLSQAPRYDPHPEYFSPFEQWGEYACVEVAGLYQFNLEYDIGQGTPGFFALEKEDGAGCE